MSRLKSSYLAVIFVFFSHLVNAQCVLPINSFPYLEGFETNNGNWSSGGLNDDWAWGSPSKPVINSAGAGIKCWITGGLTNSFYNYGERSYVESPCFDFTNLDKPYISFLIFWDTERRYDGGNLQYSLDGGSTWANAGSSSDPDECNNHNWFNLSTITNLNNFINNTQGWSGTVQPTSGSCNGGGGSNGWKLATHCLQFLGNKPSVRFRFTFGSGTTCNDYDGLAFDNFYIGSAPAIAADFNFTCTGGNTVHFSDANPNCHDSWTWNFGNSSSATNSATEEDPDHEFSSGGSFFVTLTTGGSCSVDTQVFKQVKLLSANTQTTEVNCSGRSDGSIQVIVNNGSGGITYSWSHDSLLNNSFAGALPIGDYYVTVSDPISCKLTLPVNLAYGPDAFPEVTLGKDTVLCPGSEFTLYPGKYSAYQWQDNSVDSFFTVRTVGIYSVDITNVAGCNASDSISVKEDCLQDIIVPNAFTPDGDGRNEIFYVDGSETSLFRIYIFDRWGELIFSSDDRMEGWDGKKNGSRVQEGFYNYLVNYSISGVERAKKGCVYLLY